MFKDKTFYHSHIRKAIIAFGTIFNDINIERKNSAGAVAQSIRVPLAYSTKQKFLTRIARVTDTSTRGEVAITLPRIGFEIIGLNYDPARKTQVINKSKAVGTGDKTKTVKLGFRCIFQSRFKTLSDIEINNKVQEILSPILKLDGVSIPGM